MTVSTTLNKIIYAGNAATSTFTFTFAFPGGNPAQEGANIQVFYTDPFGNITLLTQGVTSSNYQIVFNNPTSTDPTPVGGTVTYNPPSGPIPFGSFLTIYRNLPFVQASSFANQGTFYPGAFESALDYQTMVSQQVVEIQNRALVVPISDPVPSPLPAVAARAGLLLGFDVNGNPIATTGFGGGSGAVSSFNGRTGAVLPAVNDYSFSLIGGSISPTQMNSGTGANSSTFWNGAGTWIQVNFNQLAGNIGVSQMNSGTAASSLTFWRGDGTWVNFTNTALVWGAFQQFNAGIAAASGNAFFANLEYTNLAGPPAATTVSTTPVITLSNTSVIFAPTGACTVTLPSASANPGVWMNFKNVSSFTITSGSANVVPLAGGSAGTALLAGTPGKWCEIQSDGTNWQIMAGN